MSSALLAGALLVALSGSARAAANLEQTSSATGTTSASPAWSTKAVTAGHLLIAIVQWQTTGLLLSSNGTVTAPSGWVRAVASSNDFGTLTTNYVNASIYYYESCPARAQNATEAFSVSSATNVVVQIAEFSGMVTSGSFDVSGTSNAAGSSSITVASSSATATGPELAIGAFGSDATKNNQSFGGASAPFSNIGSGDISTATTDELGTYDGTVSAGTTISETITTNKTSNMVAAIATFKVAVTTYYWRGAGGYTTPRGATAGVCYGYFDDGGCWSTTPTGPTGTTAPGSADNAVFGSTGTGACTLSPLSGTATQVNQITVQSGYTGTITQSTQNLSMSGALILSGGTFVTGGSALAVTMNQSGTYDGDIIVSGGTFTGSGAAVRVRSLTVSSGAFNQNTSAVSTNNGGTAALSGGTVTFGSGALTIGAGLTVSGATVTLGNPTTAPTFTGALTVSAGTLGFTNNATTTDLSISGAFSQSGGTVNLNGAQLTTGTAIAPGTDGFTMTGGTFNTTSSTAVVNVTGNSNASGATTTLSGSAIFNGTSGTQTFAGILTVNGSASMTLGTASMTSGRHGGSSANDDMAVAIGSGGTLTLGSAGFSFPCNNAMTIAGTLNAGSGAVSFTPAVTLSGTYNANTGSTSFGSTLDISGALNANSATSVSFTGIVSMATGSTFNGGTSSGTFTAVPAFTAGTFTVGSAGTAGRWTFAQGASFLVGMTVNFPSSGGELATASTKTISMAGPVSSSLASASSTLPKIDCPACTATQGFTMQFTSSATLSLNGLQFDHVSTAGVQIADCTITLLKNLKFTNNAANGTASGTHLAITKSSTVLIMPGCYFDSTAKTNVALVGTVGSPGVRAILESSTANGPRAGESFDSDSDTSVPGDNISDIASGTTPFGSIVEWDGARPTDTTGTGVGFPTAAFDWNTFTFYAIYVAYENASGSNDVVWHRNTDGSAGYSYPVPSTSGEIVGTPYWDTIDETVTGIDANGDNDTSDTDVRVVYIGTSTGHIIKLVDDGTLHLPANGPWKTEWTDSTVTSITSPIVEDGTNLYFGGANGTTTNVYAVQVAVGSGNEAKLVRTVGSVGPISTTPAWAQYNGSTYLYFGSTAVPDPSQAYLYSINMTAGTIPSSFTGSTASFSNSLSLVNNRLYGVTTAGKLFVIDTTNAGFTSVSWSPYVTAAAKPISGAPWVDYTSSIAYFGDDGGNLYAVTSTGGTYSVAFPFSVATTKLQSPIYLQGGGVIAVGGDDGYAYFVNRDNGASAAKIIKRFYVTSAGTVSSISYCYGTSQYMVSSSDGKLVLVNASDVADPDSTH